MISFPSLTASLRGEFTVVFFTAAAILSFPIYYLYRYRSSIKRHVKEIEKNISLVRIVRDKNKTNTPPNKIVCMELDESFVKKNESEWSLMSLGDYLAQLSPADPNGFNQLFLQKELEIILGEMLLKNFGMTYGAALLPLLGVGSVAGAIGGMANKISKYFAKCILSSGAEEEDAEMVHDPLALDMSLMELISFVNINQKMNSPDNSDLSHVTPLEYLRRGESGYGDMAYDLGGDEDFPNVFDVEKEFAVYVHKMESRTPDYDPDDRSFPPPTEINGRLLPGLYLGKGDLKCTHTRREGIEHRLFCVLLNKLSYNYYLLSKQGDNNDKEELFKVVCNSTTCSSPEQLIQALVDCGHQVEVCPRVILTNFGMQLCVKEDDGSFSYIPTAVMLRTGIERTSDSKPTYFAAPHGGMDINISGPLIGSRGPRPCWIQFYGT